VCIEQGGRWCDDFGVHLQVLAVALVVVKVVHLVVHSSTPPNKLAPDSSEECDMQI
jgi:hypothetical protein